MKSCYTFIFLGWLIFLQAFALDVATQAKYPNTLLTNDYNILNESDLKIYHSDTQVGVNSWQCFPVSAISIKREILDYDSDFKLRFSTLKIIVLTGKIIHEYELPRALPVSDTQDMERRWNKLIKNEKYACIAGDFVDTEEHVNQKSKRLVKGWVFDRIKTMKGCDSFRGNCLAN